MTPELQIGITIGIGVIIVALVKYIFTREKGLFMSKEQHLIDCRQAKKEMTDAVDKGFSTFKEHFDTEMELKVLKSLRNLNGNLESKIADVVATQVNKLGIELTKKIDEKLNLVEVLKMVVKEVKKE